MWASFRLLIEVQNVLAPKLVRTVLNSWKSLKIYPTIFQTWKKSDKVWKNGKKSWGFFKGYNKHFEGIFFCLCWSLFDNLESAKRNYNVLGKSVEKVWDLVPKNLYEPCDEIKIHLCQACITCIILQLGDEDYKFLLSPTIKYYFCFSKNDKCVISLNWCSYLPILSRCLSREWRTLLSSFQQGIERWVFAVVVC